MSGIFIGCRLLRGRICLYESLSRIVGCWMRIVRGTTRFVQWLFLIQSSSGGLDVYDNSFIGRYCPSSSPCAFLAGDVCESVCLAYAPSCRGWMGRVAEETKCGIRDGRGVSQCKDARNGGTHLSTSIISLTKLRFCLPNCPPFLYSIFINCIIKSPTEWRRRTYHPRRRHSHPRSTRRRRQRLHPRPPSLSISRPKRHQRHRPRCSRDSRHARRRRWWRACH